MTFGPKASWGTRLSGAAGVIFETLKTKKARKAEAALIAYVVAELVRRGYLPSF